MVIDEQIIEVLKYHKKMIFKKENNSLYGEIYISKNDSYDVEIQLNDYPVFFPTVYELAGRIPRKLDRHIYTDSGSCCFTTRAKAQVLLKTKVTSLLVFINEILMKYLENNSFYEIKGRYFNEEYSHESGVFESYQDILGITDANRIAKVMIDRIKSKKITIRDYCYCGSGRLLKKCNKGRHNKNYRDFRKIDVTLLAYDLENHVSKFLELNK